jgi:hypothetical protein
MDAPTAPTPASAHRLVWLILVGSLAASVVVYGLLLLIIVPATSRLDEGQPSPRIWFAGIATLLLFASLAWMRWKMTLDVEPAATSADAPPLPRPESFVRNSMVALALAELPALLGFVMCITFGGRPADFVPFGIGSLAVIFFGVVPRGQHYWKSWEARHGAEPGGPRSGGG